MKFNNKQALNTTLAAGNNEYKATADSQIRALTVFNPTASNVELTIKIGGKQYVKKTVTAGATEIINVLFNQQIAKDELLVSTGEGLNMLLTIVEMTE